MVYQSGVGINEVYFHPLKLKGQLWKWMIDDFSILYPLVNIQKTMESHHANNG